MLHRFNNASLASLTERAAAPDPAAGATWGGDPVKKAGMGGLRNLRTGACCAWSLPTDATCARAARQLYGHAAAEVGIRDELICNGVMMASELAANTLHAGAGTAVRGGGAPVLVTPPPELWLYLRGSGMMRELVCKVFDAFPAWKLGRAPSPLPPRASAGAVSGRGLQVVHELSRGRWGHHLTRARLDGRKPRGKAVWFAVPVPARDGGSGPGAGDGRVADLAAIRRSRLLSARQATQELEAMLSARGLGSGLLRADQPAVDISMLWVPRGLTVCCRDGSVSLRTPGGDSQHWTYADLVDVAERAVWMHEEIGQAAGSVPGAPASPGRPRSWRAPRSRRP